MRKKIVLFLIVSLVTVNFLGLAFITTTSTSSDFLSVFPRNSMAPDGLDPMDATPEMLGEDEIAIRKYAAQVGPAIATQASPVGAPATVDDELTITVSDMGLDIHYDETFVVVMDGTHGIILIEKAAYDNYDPITDDYVFPNPNGCWRPEDRISTAQLSYLLNEFDTNIYPTDTDVFGQHLPRGDEGQKVWILIHNIRDPSYYDCSFTWYVAGYFSASEDAENNKNMMHIDSYDWANRIGPDAARPYLYEGVFAHEFQHMIHFDQDPDEPSWVDEACADLAPFLCDYGHQSGHIANYFVFHPMTSLTFWGSALADYGASYLFALYLYEKYGGAAFFTALLQEQANGIKGIENTLDAFGYKESFEEIFDAWTIANYIDDISIEDGKYGYDTLTIGSDDTWGWTIELALTYYWEIPPETAPTGFPSDWFYGIEPQPYTAHYFRLTTDRISMVTFEGDDFSGTTAYSGTDEWYSDADAWAWRSFYQTFDIPAGGATLNFMTFFEIEWNWDYGYVEVYDHDTGEWSTLYDPTVVMYDDYFDPHGMVDYVGHPQNNPNCPDGREPRDYEAAGTWCAFTGYSDGWIPVSMDLSDFKGHTIDLYFTSWQDGAFTLQMMYVDDISIPEIGFFDDVESGEDGWDTTGWYITDGILDNSFGVTMLKTEQLYPWDITLESVRHMRINPVKEKGRMLIFPVEPEEVYVAIVSNRADHILTSHYDLYVDQLKAKGWLNKLGLNHNEIN